MAFNTADRIITYAMVDAGLIAEGDTPTAAQYATYVNRLNDIINLWQTQGVKLWTNVDLSVTLVAGQGMYTFGPSSGIVMTKPMRILDESYYMDANGIKRPVSLIGRQDYNRLSTNTQQGPINQIYVDKQLTQLIVNTWLVPDANTALGTLHVVLQQQITNLVTSSDTLSFPQEWFIALRWGLADDICTGQPQAIMDRCKANATAYREALEGWDVDDAPVMFTPDQRHRR